LEVFELKTELPDGAQKGKNYMKEFTQYSSVEDVIRDLITEGIFPRNRKVRAAFPRLGPTPQRDHIKRLKAAILDRMTEASRDLLPALSQVRLYRAVRGDNHPVEYEIAIRDLIEERRITKQRLETGQRSRPAILFHLFEF
jgi:hypothetical protein